VATRFRLDNVVTQSIGEPRPASWTFAGRPVAGVEHSYRVIDENYPRRNEWEFVVRVPKNTAQRTEVRPVKAPNVSAWATLERRSLTFKRANRRGYRGQVYCPASLADPTGEKSRTLAKEKALLPRWFDQLETRIRRKTTVASTRGTDADTLVLFCGPDDHEFMIRAFFALKVWVLRESTASKHRAA